MEITYTELMKMDVDALCNLNQMAVEIIKVKKELLGKEKVRSLSVGDEFKINHKNHFGVVYIVEKINKKKVIGKNKKTGARYNIPFEMIERI